MKTLEPPKPSVVYHIRCQHTGCAALLECSIDDLRDEGDYQMGPSWVMTCPHCKRDSYIRDLRSFAREPT